MTTSIQHTLQFLIRPLTARNSISLKSRIMGARGLSVRVPETFETHWCPGVGRLCRLAAASNVVRGVDALDVAHNPASGYRRDKRNSASIHGTDLTSRQKKQNVRKSRKKKKKNDSSMTSVCLETRQTPGVLCGTRTSRRTPRLCKSMFSQIALGPATVYSPELDSSAGATSRSIEMRQAATRSSSSCDGTVAASWRTMTLHCVLALSCNLTVSKTEWMPQLLS